MESTEGSEFVFDYIRLLYYKSHKINSNQSCYRYRLSWLDKKKKATSNLINKKDDKCFQYVLTVALNHEEIKTDSQRITKIKPEININKYN